MARRAGKAASRKARQRSVQQRSTQRAGRPATTPTAPADDAPTFVPPVGTPDAREAVSLDPPRPVSARPATHAGSTLTSRERAEYHYVERDLRNIGILSVVMVVLLLVAWFAFSALNLTG
jgi:hypothetical protein